ncbi:MAG: C40 family peptidase [Propionibacteriaceae bacterium]|jgi:cell wall-associated NlpC family hydrolase|nr:C40 family peptidase [Propionibacteriaceae bacterium]
MQHGKAIRIIVAGVAAVALVFSGFAIPSATADPSDLDKAKERVKQLELEASEADEAYDEAKIKLDEGKKRVSQLRKDIAAQTELVNQLTTEARQVALLQYQNRGINTSLQIFGEGDPDTLLGQLSTVSKVDENLNATLQEQQSQQAELLQMQRALDSEVAALAADEKRLAQIEDEVESKLAEAQAIVDELTLEALMELDQSDGAAADFDLSEISGESANAKALGAVKYAISKVKTGQYVWGASGPNSFDCSGLMLASYRSVGISLPHSSKAQSKIGRAVSRSELKPGDLIFWYHPIHHVGMYIGGGKIVHARNTRSDLVIQTLNSYPAPYAGARRVVG